MAEHGTIPENIAWEAQRDQIQQWITIGMSGAAVVAPELVPPAALAKILVLYNSYEALHDRYVSRTATPEEIADYGKEMLSALRDAAAVKEEEWITDMWSYANASTGTAYGDAATQDIEREIGAAFRDRARSLPKLRGTAQENMIQDPELKALAEWIDRAIEERLQGSLTPETRTALQAAGIEAADTVMGPLREYAGSVVEKLKALEKITDEKLRAEAQRKAIDEINATARQAQAGLEAVVTVLGKFDAEAAHAVNIVGGAALKVGLNLALIHTGKLDLESVSGIISGVFSLGDLFGGQDELALKRHIQIMEALGRIERSVYEVHKEMIEARQDINWLHRDANQHFLMIHQELSRIEAEIARGFGWSYEALSKLQLGQLASQELLHAIASDVNFLVNFSLDTQAQQQIDTVRTVSDRLRRGTAPFSGREVEDGLFTLHAYALQTIRGTYNINGGRYAPEDLADPIKAERIGQRRPEMLTGFYGRLFSSDGVYRNGALVGLLFQTKPQEFHQQLPAVGEYAEALSAYCEILLRHYPTLNSEQREGEAAAHLLQLRELLAEGGPCRRS
ncbi:MAG: hypothetical protein QY326_07260 [Bdellovibrionota bacterium]|nr:MAG: hypothetical protein QY326_07260 [Bdellovibrionota bacterium]